MTEAPARRVESGLPLEPGEYWFDTAGSFSHGIPAVHYRLPNGSRGHCCSPPHTFRECPDGSMEIRASIGHTVPGQDELNWHGYLDEGNVWREC